MDFIDKFGYPLYSGLLRTGRSLLSILLSTGLVFLGDNVADIFKDVQIDTTTKAALVGFIGALILGIDKWLRERNIINNS